MTTESLNEAMKYYVTAFYKFMPLEDLETIKATLNHKASELDLRGLVILGHEGINSTSAAPSSEALADWKSWLQTYFAVSAFDFKNSESKRAPFRKFQVKVRDEICTIGHPELKASNEDNNHLSPEQWNHVLKEEQDFVMVDTRNWYEHKIGSFKGAINPKIDQFTDFFDQVDSMNLPKDKKMLVFCTGGIRCHKGILELQRRGYDKVFQLKGGILKYLEEFPNDQFAGECFVFDHRVALDQQLKPSAQYGLCPHCGQPSELDIHCKRCDFQTKICDDCVKLEFKKDTCSKNCAYHFELHPERKAAHQNQATETPRLRAT